MLIAEHLVATTRNRERSLTTFEQASRLWVRLLTALPGTLSLVLMPDHLHLVAMAGLSPKLRRVLTGFTQATGVRFDLRPVVPANTRASAARMIRYGYLNPVRAGLVDDPWCWPWSTLRDLIGAASPVLLDTRQVSTTLGYSRSQLVRGFSVARGLPVPPPRARVLETLPIPRLVAATAAALRTVPHRVPTSIKARRLAVQLAKSLQQPSDVDLLGKALQIHPGSVRRIQRAAPHPGLAAATLCAADLRLAPPGVDFAVAA